MDKAENPSRERILARIAAALAAPAPHHHGGNGAPAFAPVTDALDRFQKECASNNTECLVVPNFQASATAIAELLAGLPPGEIFVQDSPELRTMASSWSSHPIRWSPNISGDTSRNTSGDISGRNETRTGPSESSQATITMAEALVAQTGSILVSAACGGRAAAFVAPVHIVVAKSEQLVPDLQAALSQARERGTAANNSYLCFITGSSRTADIEKILVMGAHGPRRLFVTVALRAE